MSQFLAQFENWLFNRPSALETMLWFFAFFAIICAILIGLILLGIRAYDWLRPVAHERTVWRKAWSETHYIMIGSMLIPQITHHPEGYYRETISREWRWKIQHKL